MSNDTIFREVDEELRSDRMRALWRRFAPWIIGAMVLIVLAVAVNEGWSWWQNSRAAAASDQFYAALELEEAGDTAGAQSALQAIAASGGGYGTLAQFKAAGLLASEGRAVEAVAAYDAISTSASDSMLRNLALLLAANVLVDSGTLADVQARVGGLAEPSNPLHNSALEAIGLAQYKAGDLQGAAASFQAVVDDPTATRDQASRVQLFLDQVRAEGGVETPPVASAAPSPDTAAPAPAEWLPANALAGADPAGG